MFFKVETLNLTSNRVESRFIESHAQDVKPLMVSSKFSYKQLGPVVSANLILIQLNETGALGNQDEFSLCHMGNESSSPLLFT